MLSSWFDRDVGRLAEEEEAFTFGQWFACTEKARGRVFAAFIAERSGFGFVQEIVGWNRLALVIPGRSAAL